MIGNVSAFHYALKNLIEREYGQTLSNLGNGRATDYAAYRELVGYCRALAWVLGQCSEIFDGKDEFSSGWATHSDEEEP